MRTGDMSRPYPEEMNRVLTARLSTLHLAATARARSHLLAEGTPASSVFVTGNTVIDALHWTLSHHRVITPFLLDILKSPRPMLLVTAHRRESWGEPLRQIAEAIAELARLEPDLLVLFPVHRNPAVGNTVRSILRNLPNVRLTQPLNYFDFVTIMQRARIILTDSGGIQEEAPSLGIPVLVMRDNTERLEAVEAGTSRLVGTSRHKIVDGVLQLLHDDALYLSMTTPANPYGDGHATGRVIAALRHLLHGAPAPAEFAP
jgi:UDP-N-acetylglucosamine 2-epimerase (non-hydrolysing)